MFHNKRKKPRDFEIVSFSLSVCMSTSLFSIKHCQREVIQFECYMWYVDNLYISAVCGFMASSEARNAI